MYLFLFFSIVAGLRRHCVPDNADSQRVTKNACMARKAGNQVSLVAEGLQQLGDILTMLINDDLKPVVGNYNRLQEPSVHHE